MYISDLKTVQKRKISQQFFILNVCLNDNLLDILC